VSGHQKGVLEVTGPSAAELVPRRGWSQELAHPPLLETLGRQADSDTSGNTQPDTRVSVEFP
jgi:hypothetical protein